MHSTRYLALSTVITVALLGNTACTTTQTMHASQGALEREKIHAGDKVTLYYSDGRAVKLRLTHVDASTVTGTAKDGRAVVAAYAQLDSMGHREIAVGRTVGVVLGVVVVGAAMAGAAAAEILSTTP